MTPPEVWLRGPLPETAGLAAPLVPVAHALLQARADVGRLAAELEALGPEAAGAALAARPGGAASAGWHLRHLAGSLDRLLAYARGEGLTDAQQRALAEERAADAPPLAAGALAALVDSTVARALEQLRLTPDAALGDERRVGKAGLPTTVLGILAHAGEHTARHVGQCISTLKIVRGLAAGPTSAGSSGLPLTLLREPLAICRLEAGAPLPAWTEAARAFLSVGRTPTELSIVADAAVVPPGVPGERGWRALRVEGPLPLDLVGILASVAAPLAEAGISIFPIATYDTDYVLVKGADLERARAALAAAGHRVGEE